MAQIKGLSGTGNVWTMHVKLHHKAENVKNNPTATKILNLRHLKCGVYRILYQAKAGNTYSAHMCHFKTVCDKNEG